MQTHLIGLNIYDMIGKEPIEHFVLVILNPDNEYHEYVYVTTGNDREVTVDLKVVRDHILKTKYRKIIIAHNHPNKHLVEPSKQDIISHRKEIKYFKLHGIDMVDSLIVGQAKPNDYFSFKENRKLLDTF